MNFHRTNDCLGFLRWRHLALVSMLINPCIELTTVQVITSDGNSLRLEFLSDNSVQKNGFAAIFFTDKVFRLLSLRTSKVCSNSLRTKKVGSSFHGQGRLSFSWTSPLHGQGELYSSRRRCRLSSSRTMLSSPRTMLFFSRTRYAFSPKQCSLSSQWKR